MITVYVLLLIFAYQDVVLSKNCGQTLYTADSGSISIDNYDRSTHCEYEIRLSSRNHWTQLRWETFNIDGDMPTCKDYVKVYTG